ncbi:MAG TPA: rhodanese-like domain-containing protein [Anaeromyxobacteraceae bacterium]|nr:rhodanese-like domain-containing protein [Anaeromyxobacteraceae bacterium]
MHAALRRPARLAALTALLAVAGPAGAAQPDGKSAKVCTTCHKTAEPGTLRGHFDQASMKSRSFQMKIDGEVEVLTFDPAALKVVNATETGDLEKVLKGIRAGAEARVEYTLDGNVKRASVLSLKPKLAVPEEKQVKTEELEKLVALGPAKGKYFLFDARPAPKFAEGHIPTAENLPFPAFEKEKGKLPADKGALVVFYCAGATCAMSPAARDAAEKLGYTNAKAYHEGIPVWSKKNPLALSPKLLKEAWLDKGQPIIVLDARKKAKGVIPGSAAMTDGSQKSVDRLYQFRKVKPPIVVYDEDGTKNAQVVARAIIASGQAAMVLTGGVQAWKAAGYPLADGAPAAEIVFVPKPKPGSMPVDQFKTLVAAIPAGTVVLDVRGADEVAGGAIPGTLHIPADQVAGRLAELPKEKRIVTHCSTGTRAEMTYNVLRGAGYPDVAFLDAPVDFDGGQVEIGE